MHYAGVVRTFSVTSFSIIKRDMLRQILLQLFFILAKKNLCTFLGRGKFAEIKEIKEISRKSLKNPKMDSSSPNSSRKMITKNFKFFMCIY